MHIDRRFLHFGVFFIALGVVPLGVQLGWLDRAAVGDAARLWPVLLIAIGLGILLARSPFELVGGVLSAALFGLFLGGGLAAGAGALGCAGVGNGATTFPTSSGTFLGNRAVVDVTVDCGTANLSTSSGSAWSLSGTDDANRQPSVTATSDHLVIGASRGGAIFNFRAAQPEWQIRLPTDPSLGVSIGINGGSAHLDLRGARLDVLDATINAGSVRADLSAASIGALDATINAGDLLVALPAAPISASLTVNAGHLGLCVPPGVGLTIEMGGVLSGNNFASQGLGRNGNTWTSPGAATAEVRIDLQVTVNAGGVDLNPDGGCT